jgi:integrase
MIALTIIFVKRWIACGLTVCAGSRRCAAHQIARAAALALWHGRAAAAGSGWPARRPLQPDRAGIDATDYSGHSLRAGLVTAAAMAGVSERVIMLQTGHKNIVVLRRYIREGLVFRENAAAAVGL